MFLEVEKRDPDLQLLDELMIATFSQHRKEIIGDEPLISAVMDRWPAMFSERQVILCQLSSTAQKSCILLLEHWCSQRACTLCCNHICDFFVFLPLQLYAALNFPHSCPFLCRFVICLFQLSAVFSRIVTKDLLESFLDGLEALVTSLLELYKAAAGG